MLAETMLAETMLAETMLAEDVVGSNGRDARMKTTRPDTAPIAP